MNNNVHKIITILIKVDILGKNQCMLGYLL